MFLGKSAGVQPLGLTWGVFALKGSRCRLFVWCFYGSVWPLSRLEAQDDAFEMLETFLLPIPFRARPQCTAACACAFQVRDTVLPSRSSALVNPPFPTYFTEEEGDLEEDLYEDDLFVHTEPSLTLT